MTAWSKQNCRPPDNAGATALPHEHLAKSRQLTYHKLEKNQYVEEKRRCEVNSPAASAAAACMHGAPALNPPKQTRGHNAAALEQSHV